MVGPGRGGAAPTAVHRPIAAARRSGPNSREEERERGGDQGAAPVAWIARAPTRKAESGDAAHSATR